MGDTATAIATTSSSGGFMHESEQNGKLEAKTGAKTNVPASVEHPKDYYT